MDTVYNVQPAEVFIIVILGDTINLTFSVDQNDVDYIMTGMQLDIKVKNKKGTTVKTLSSAGSSPAIIIDDDEFTISTTAFADAGTYDYDLQLTNGSNVWTIMYGQIQVNKQIT